MSRGFEKRRVMFFRNAEPSLADPIARHGGVPLAVGAAGDPAESPKGAVQQVMAGAVDFLLFAHPDQVARLVNTSSLEVSARAPIAVTRFNQAGDLVVVSSDFQSELRPLRSLVPVGDVRSGAHCRSAMTAQGRKNGES